MTNPRVRKLKQFVFRAGSHVTGVDAQTAGEELARIRDERGSVRPIDVVDEARPEDAPLHPVFEWDDQAAAESWRKEQARHLIRSVHVVTTSDQAPAPVYVNVVNEEGEREYQPISVVVRQPDRFQVALTEARARVASAAKAVQDLLSAASEAEAARNATALARIRMHLNESDAALRALASQKPPKDPAPLHEGH